MYNPMQGPKRSFIGSGVLTVFSEIIQLLRRKKVTRAADLAARLEVSEHASAVATDSYCKERLPTMAHLVM